MEIELHSVVSLLTETFSVPIAPVEMLAKAPCSHLDLQRYKILNISSIRPRWPLTCSRLQSRLTGVFCIYDGQAAQREAKMPGAQRTLEVCS
jgi:hypothetical protein